MQSRARLQQLSRGCIALVVLALLTAQSPLWDAFAPGAPLPAKAAPISVADPHLPSLTAAITVTPDPVTVGTTPNATRT